MKEVNTMQKYVALFFTLLAGNIVGHYICKCWTAAMSNRQQYKKKRQNLYFCRLYRFLSEFPSKNLYIRTVL